MLSLPIRHVMDQAALLLQVINDLPPDVNRELRCEVLGYELKPCWVAYAWLKVEVWRQISPHYQQWAITSLYINIGLACLCFAFALYSLWARWREKTLWLFRLQRSAPVRAAADLGVDTSQRLVAGLYCRIPAACGRLVAQSTVLWPYGTARL
jgi:hypothetical protein